MDARRVVTVQPSGGAGGSAGPGSGYVVAPRLVLTAAHAAPAKGERVAVCGAGEPTVCTGVVTWRGSPGGRDDAALVEVDDPGWRPREGGTVRWGRVVTNRPGIPCEAWGFPALVQRAGRAAETAQPAGTLNPGDRYVGDRYVMSIAGYPPAPGGDGTSPWGGLSGAALFCGDLLAGVVATDPAGGQHAHLEATPAYVLQRDAGFRAVLAGHGIREVILEPVELQELTEPEPALARSPASLLRARQQMVAFRGRERLLGDLDAWAQGPGFAAWLLYGPGGQGKTRFGQELATRLSQDRWAWLWLRKDAPADRLELLAAAAVPLLVIVDYAETRTGQVTAALRACARHGGGVPLRMLLLARTAGDWWERLQASSSQAEELLEGAPVIRLPELEPHPTGRPEAYRQAVAAFADALPCVPGQQDRDWDRIASRLATPKLDAPGLASALTLHMIALADLLETAELPEPAGGPVEDRLLNHERRYWIAAAAARGLLSALTEATLIGALTAAFLLGADDRDSAEALLRRVPGLHDQPEDRQDAVRRWIADLYPPVDARPWGSLQPDRLAERFVGTHLATEPELAERLVPGASPAQAGQLLTTYARAAHHPAFQGQLDAQLTSLCVRHHSTLALPAIDVATQLEASAPLIDALRQLTTNPDTPREYLAKMAGRLPPASQNLAEWAAELAQRLTDEDRRLATEDPDAFLPDLAGSLHNLSGRLARLGRREDALAASEEATGIRRELAEALGDAFRPDLARSLHNLAYRLGKLGRREDALAASEEATAIYRELAFRPGLARSLNNLAYRLADLGRREDALAASEEATGILRELAAALPDAFRPDLARSLHNLAYRLGKLGRREDALAASEEAVGIRRELAAARPDAFRPDLAASLNNLSGRLAGLGRREDALAASEEATSILRELAAALPDAFRPDLARSLHNLAYRLGKLGRREDARAAIGEAVNIRRTLAARWPDAYRHQLEQSRRVAARLENGEDPSGASPREPKQ